MQAQLQRVIAEASTASIDSSSQSGQSEADIKDIVWTKMQALKEKYLHDLKDLCNLLAARSQQPMPKEQHLKLSHYKTVLQRMLPYLVAPKGTLPKEFKQDKVDAFEKQIVNIMETFKRRRQAPQQQHQTPSPPPPPPPASLGPVQTVQQQVHQVSQSLQQDKLVQPTQQAGAPLLGTPDPQSNNASNNSFSILQSNMPSMQQNIVNTAQSGLLNGLQAANPNALLQNNLAALQPSGMQQQVTQQEQQQLFQARILKEQEQLKQLQQQRQMQHQQDQIQHKQQQPSQIMQAQKTQQLQPLQDAISDNKAAKQAAVKQMLFHHQLSSRAILPQQQHQQKALPSQTASSPQLSSPPQMSPQSDLQNMNTSALHIPKIGTPVQAATPPFSSPSPAPLQEDSGLKSPTPAVSTVITGIGPSNATNASNVQPSFIGTPGFSVSPLLPDYTTSPQNMSSQDRAQTCVPGLSEERQTISEPPLERIVKVMNSMSSKALASAVRDINMLVSLSDKLGGSAPGSQSRAVVGEDLAQVTKCRAQARALTSPDGSAINRKVKRRIDSMAMSVVSSVGSVVNSLQKLNGSDWETESTATSRIKRRKIEVSQSLEEEMNYINEQLIDTWVEVDADGIEAAAAADGKKGLVVTCTYNALSLNLSVPFQSNLLHMVPLSPLRLFIPAHYPECSPIVLADDTAPNQNHQFSRLAREEFSRALRCLPPPVMLGDMVRVWDASVRSVVVEAATLQGGGCFSSTFGSWEGCVSA